MTTIWTHPYAQGRDLLCAWTSGGGVGCRQPEQAPVHARSAPHTFVPRADGRCGFEVGGAVLCGITRYESVHRL